MKLNLKKIQTKYKKTSINMGNLKHSQVAITMGTFSKSKHLLQIHTCVVAVFLQQAIAQNPHREKHKSGSHYSVSRRTGVAVKLCKLDFNWTEVTAEGG